MLSTSYAMCNSDLAGSTVLAILALLVVIDIILFIYSIYCLFDCVNNNGISKGSALALGLLLFVPGLGLIPSIGIIIYHHIYCRKPAQYRFDYH